MTTKIPSTASQLKEIENLRRETAEIRLGITVALRIARRTKDKKAIRKCLDLRQRCKTSLVRLRQVERVIRKGEKRRKRP